MSKIIKYSQDHPEKQDECDLIADIHDRIYDFLHSLRDIDYTVSEICRYVDNYKSTLSNGYELAHFS